MLDKFNRLSHMINKVQKKTNRSTFNGRKTKKYDRNHTQ